MLLLTQLLGLTESLTEVGPEVFSAWPTPLNSNFVVIYTYPDCFFIEALSFLASADPGKPREPLSILQALTSHRIWWYNTTPSSHPHL